MIVGNSHILSFFDRCISADDFSGTYLFVGPESVGKTYVALEIARAIQHLQNDDESLGRRVFRGTPGDPPAHSCDCDSCSAIAQGTHPDVLLFEKSLTIEDARACKQQLAQSPLAAPFHIAIIPNIHRATAEAAQALLKLLEEPAPATIFFLTAEYLSSVPATIVSRSLPLHFSLATKKEMQKLIPSASQQKMLQELLPYWQGRPGRLVRILEDADEQKRLLETKKEANDFLKGNLTKRFALAKEIGSLERPQAIATLEEWMVWWEHACAFQPLRPLRDLYQAALRTPIHLQNALEYLAVNSR